MKSLGEKIRFQRTKKHITQEQLADLVNVHSNTIRQWEKSKNSPKIDDIKKIAKVLEISTSELLDDIPTQSRNSIEKDSKLKLDLGLAYWGEVADNIRELSENTDKEKVAIIKSMLLSSLDTINIPINAGGI